MHEHDICPWCLTEIVWDEEIGPEEHCPHCENELSGYRTVQIGGSNEEHNHIKDQQEEEWLENDGSEEHEDALWMEQGEGYRHADKAWLAAQSTLQGIINEQDEAPECPSCREFMLETGSQHIDKEQFKPAIIASTGQPVLEAPFNVIWYVCPACFHTSSKLSAESREAMLKRLTPKE